MSNIPKYHRIKNCKLFPGDAYKNDKFSDKSTGSRLSKIKSCAKTSTFKGRGRMNAQGYNDVQTSSSRTSVTVSYTHLKLPTILLVSISVVAVSL